MLRTSLAAVFSIIASAPLLAAAPARTVGYADLDLASRAGQARLEQRLDGAVRAVCGTAAPTDLAALAEVRRCRAETRAAIAAPRPVREALAGLGAAR